MTKLSYLIKHFQIYEKKIGVLQFLFTVLMFKYDISEHKKCNKNGIFCAIFIAV